MKSQTGLYVIFLLVFIISDAKAQKKSRADTSKDGSIIYTSVERVASFPGGTNNFLSFIKRNLHYPDSARIKRIEGVVEVSFVVKEDGHLSDISIIQGVTPELNAEAIRVVSLSPAWRPGIQNNRPVKMIFSVPIGFKL